MSAPIPSYITSEQTAYLATVYPQARKAMPVRFRQRVSGIQDRLDRLEHRQVPGFCTHAANVIYSHWPFTRAAIVSAGEAYMASKQGDTTWPPSWAEWLTPPSVDPPAYAGAARFALTLGFGMRGEPYAPEGAAFYGMRGPDYFGLFLVRARQWAAAYDPGYTLPESGGGFASMSSYAQSSIYGLYFPEPLFFCLPGNWPLPTPDDSPSQSAIAALEQYSLDVWEGKVVIGP